MKLKILIPCLVVAIVLLISMPLMIEEVSGDYIKPEMVFIQGGTFDMGSESGDEDEKPLHTVTLDSFYIGKYEVTNEEYKQFKPDHNGNYL